MSFSVKMHLKWYFLHFKLLLTVKNHGGLAVVCFPSVQLCTFYSISIYLSLHMLLCNPLIQSLNPVTPIPCWDMWKYWGQGDLWTYVFVCLSRVFRSTLTSIPQTQSLLNKAKMPLGLLLHPFKDLSVTPQFNIWCAHTSASHVTVKPDILSCS